MKIEDGKGKKGDASVSSDQRLDVSSRSNSRSFYVSRDLGLAFNAIYNFTAAANDIVAYVKNTSSTKNLFITAVEFHAVEAVKWKVFSCTGTAAAGETVTPSNLNLSSGKIAEATAMAGDTTITGLTSVAQIGTQRSVATGSVEMNFQDALLLGPEDAIYVEYDTGTAGIGEADIFMHFEDFDF